MEKWKYVLVWVVVLLLETPCKTHVFPQRLLHEEKSSEGESDDKAAEKTAPAEAIPKKGTALYQYYFTAVEKKNTEMVSLRDRLEHECNGTFTSSQAKKYNGLKKDFTALQDYARNVKSLRSADSTLGMFAKIKLKFSEWTMDIALNKNKSPIESLGERCLPLPGEPYRIDPAEEAQEKLEALNKTHDKGNSSKEESSKSEGEIYEDCKESYHKILKRISKGASAFDDFMGEKDSMEKDAFSAKLTLFSTKIEKVHHQAHIEVDKCKASNLTDEDKANLKEGEKKLKEEFKKFKDKINEAKENANTEKKSNSTESDDNDTSQKTTENDSKSKKSINKEENISESDSKTKEKTSSKEKENDVNEKKSNEKKSDNKKEKESSSNVETEKNSKKTNKDSHEEKSNNISLNKTQGN